MFEKVLHRVVPGGKVVRTWPLKGGISGRMTSIEYETPAGHLGRVVLRRLGEWALEKHLHLAKQDFMVLQAVEPLGVGAPQPLYFDDSGEIVPDPYFVTTFVEGSPEYQVQGGIERAVKMAKRLALVHSFAASQLCALPDCSKTYDRLVSRVPEQMNEELLEPEVRGALGSAWRVDSSDSATLIHGDFWPGNVLWLDGEISGVVDWEEAGTGDPLYDLALSRLDVFWAYGSAAMDAFTATYSSETGRDLTRLPYWDLVIALRPIQDLDMWAAASPELGREDMTAERMGAGLKWFIEEALARL